MQVHERNIFCLNMDAPFFRIYFPSRWHHFTYSLSHSYLVFFGAFPALADQRTLVSWCFLVLFSDYTSHHADAHRTISVGATEFSYTKFWHILSRCSILFERLVSKKSFSELFYNVLSVAFGINVYPNGVDFIFVLFMSM